MSMRRVAVVLAGGKGGRLAPYTTVLPKPLMPVGDLPIIDILVRQLVANGFSELIFSIGHLGGLLEAYFNDHPLRSEGVSFEWVRENTPLGTTGAIALVKNLPQNFLVLNGDILTTLDFREMFEYHVASGGMLTVASKNKQTRVQLGVLKSEGNVVTDYVEKPVLDYEVSMGVYAYNRGVLRYVDSGEPLDFPDLVLRLIRAGETVRCFRSEDEWLDIGNIEDFTEAQKVFSESPEKYLPNEYR
jgi:NDP-sugar pyrophosphorylase family protein